MVRIGVVRGTSEQQPEFWHSKLVVRLCENKTRRRQFCTADEDCKPVHGVRSHFGSSLFSIFLLAQCS